MLNIIIVWDEDDQKAGQFYKNCVLHIDTLLESNSCQLIHISKNQLTSLFLEMKISGLNGESFILVAFSHGSRTSLLSSGEDYISISSPLALFNNSFIYTFACHSANELSSALIQNGCISFFGYKNEVFFITTYEQIFMECANFGLEKMLENINSGDAFKAMKEKYNNHIDEIADFNYAVAATLMENRDALELNGRNDFYLSEIGH